MEVKCTDPDAGPSNPFEQYGDDDYLGINGDYIKI